MRFFKYLIFLILSFISINVFAEVQYSVDEYTWHSTADAACKAVFGSTASANTSTKTCWRNGGLISGYYQRGTQECWHPDYKIVSQPITSLKKTMCLPVNGVICKYVGDPSKAPIVNGAVTTTFSSVSKTPDPSCKEQLLNPPCDPKDPYGGCFTPTPDGCTRQFDGSIVCPEEKEPPIEKGCKGADYCDRPPQGCGSGYVSGSFNGKQICIKTSPSTGSGSGTGGEDGEGGEGTGSSSGTGEGTGTSTSTGSQSTTTTTTHSDGSSSTSTSTTTTNNTTVNNFKIDLSGVISAVKEVSSKITNLKNELLTSITNLTNKVDQTNIKLDSTNLKLDTSNNHLSSIKDSNLRQELLLKDIRDKTNSDNGNPTSPTDLTGVHTRLDAIKEGIDKKNEFDKDFSQWAKDPDFKDDSNPAFSGDSKVEIQESTAAPDLKDNYVSASAQCPPPLQISFNLLRTHTLTFSYDTMCLGASFARPFVIFSGMLIAFLIVTGVYRGSSDA
jgi:hypothetical protein